MFRVRKNRILYLSHVFIPSINNDNRNVTLIFVVCFIFSNMKMYQDFFLSLLLLSNRKFSNRGKCFHFAQLSSNNYQQERVDGFELLKSIELLKKIYPKFLLSVEHACDLLALYLFVWHNLAAVQTLHVERGYQTRRNWFECTIWHIWAKFAILRRSGGLGEKRSIWSAILNCSYSWESNAAFKHANSEYLVNCAQWVQNW